MTSPTTLGRRFPPVSGRVRIDRDDRDYYPGGTSGIRFGGGIFLTFSNFDMKALDRLPEDQGIATMQAVNVTVFNPRRNGEKGQSRS